MEIKTRWAMGKKYLEVKIIEGGTTIDLGLLNEEERDSLAKQLRGAVEELEYKPD